MRSLTHAWSFPVKQRVAPPLAATQLLIGLLPIALVAALGCVPGDSDVYIRIERPAAGETVGGIIICKFSYVRPAGFRYWNMTFDDNPLDRARQKGTPECGGLYTWTLDNGPHRMKVQMVAWGFRTWEHSVDFVVDNPPQRLLVVDMQGRASPGGTYEATLEFNLPGLRVEAEQFDMPDVSISEVELVSRSPKTFSLRFPVPRSDDVQSRHVLTLGVAHPSGRRLSIPVEILLDL